MTNKKTLLLLTSVVVIMSAGAYFYFSTPKLGPVTTLSEKPQLNPGTQSTAHTPDAFKPAPARSPASSSYVNKPSPVWKDRLVSSLKEQAGDSLKDVQVKKERSLIWNYNSVPLSAESVVVTIKSHQGEETSFRAIVDSQTGKILESWDKPISDPADVRAGFHIKLDERYSN